MSTIKKPLFVFNLNIQENMYRQCKKKSQEISDILMTKTFYQLKILNKLKECITSSVTTLICREELLLLDSLSLKIKTGSKDNVSLDLCNTFCKLVFQFCVANGFCS